MSQAPPGSPPVRAFLFLQGPTNLLFAKVAARLRALGHRTCRINVCSGDALFWRGGGETAFRGRPEAWPEFLGAFLAEHAITDLVLLGEKRSLHQAAIALARERGIAVTVTDFGYLRPDWVIVERDGLNAESRFPRDPQAILAAADGLPPIDRQVRYPHHAFNQALWDMAFHLSSALVRWPYPHFRRHTLNSPFLNYLGTGWRLARQPLEQWLARRTIRTLRAPYFVFAMQMEDDFSLRAYSHYPDLDAAMREAVASFAAHAPGEATLVFKVHPLDPGLKAWRRRIARLGREHGVANRLRYIDGGDLDTLLARSAGVVTVNSTAGLRAVELLRPVLVLGQALYRIPGLAFEGALDAFWAQPKGPDPALADAWMRLLAASLHVRGSHYDPAGIEAAAEGMAHRLHHRLVNAVLPEVLSGEAWAVPAAGAGIQ